MIDMPRPIDSSCDRSAMTARVLVEAKRLYQGVADDVILEQYASEAVAQLWTARIKVTTFVPLLALRQIRDALDVEGGMPVPQQTPVGALSTP